MYQVIVLCAVLGVTHSGVIPKKDSPGEVLIHATNNTSTPNVHYIVDAVEFLKEAYSIYPTDDDRAKVYAELFEEEHPETHWNVVAGYSTAYIKSQWYVETTVEGAKNKDKKDKEDDKETKYLIFSTV